MAKIGWIGLGTMGFSMAGHLANAGHEVTVYNRNELKVGTWLEKYHGAGARSPSQVAENADFVFSCVGEDQSLQDVTLGADGAFGAMSRGAVYVDCTTTSADIARTLCSLAEQRGIHFLDAPVSGGQKGAETGTLTVMVGGTKSVFDRALPVLQHFARKVTLIGDSGDGQTAKMVNQICIAGVVQGLAEGIALAKRANLDLERVMTLTEGAAGSWQMSNRWRTMDRGEYDFGFAVDWMRKDLGIALAEGRRVGASLPVTALVDQFYADIQKIGGNRLDTSSLLKRLMD